MKKLFIALMFSALFVSCNKTGIYGFKEGQTYVLDGEEHKDATFKVIKVSSDYVIFTKEGVTPPNIWYNRKMTNPLLRAYVGDFKLAD